MLESYASKERDKAAALKFIKKAMKRHGRPKAIVTDGLLNSDRRSARIVA